MRAAVSNSLNSQDLFSTSDQNCPADLTSSVIFAENHSSSTIYAHSVCTSDNSLFEPVSTDNKISLLQEFARRAERLAGKESPDCIAIREILFSEYRTQAEIHNKRGERYLEYANNGGGAEASEKGIEHLKAAVRLLRKSNENQSDKLIRPLTTLLNVFQRTGAISEEIGVIHQIHQVYEAIGRSDNPTLCRLLFRRAFLGAVLGSEAAPYFLQTAEEGADSAGFNDHLKTALVMTVNCRINFEQRKFYTALLNGEKALDLFSATATPEVYLEEKLSVLETMCKACLELTRQGQTHIKSLRKWFRKAERLYRHTGLPGDMLLAEINSNMAEASSERDHIIRYAQASLAILKNLNHNSERTNYLSMINHSSISRAFEEEPDEVRQQSRKEILANLIISHRFANRLARVKTFSDGQYYCKREHLRIVEEIKSACEEFLHRTYKRYKTLAHHLRLKL